MRTHDRIESNPAVMLGKPVIRGTRVPVEIVVGALAGGLPAAEAAREYGITVADVRAALAYAARVLGDERVRLSG